MTEESLQRGPNSMRLDSAFFSRLLGSVNDLVWCVSLDLQELQYINPAAASIYGRPLQEIIASKRLWLDAIHPEDRGKLEANLRQLGSRPVEQLYRVVQPSGHIRWLEGRFGRIQSEGNGDPIGIGGIAKDVTKRITTERALEEATAVYLSLVESLPINVFRKDREGRIRFGNQRYCDSFGKPLDELLGKTDYDLFAPDIAEKYTLDDRRVIETGQVFQDVEEHPTPTGDSIYVEVLKAPVRDAAGNIVGIQGMFWDVTQRKQAEQALREAKDLAEAASKAKSDFLANMSHEIRTPMNAILGMTELLLDTDLDASQREYLMMVSQSADALLTVINDVLDFSKIEAGKLELEPVAFDLREELGDTMKSLALRAHEAGLELAFQVEPDVPELLIGDAKRLRQIVVNLVGNAIKFTRRGEVVLSIRLESIKDDQCEVLLTVTDTGIGIPRDRLTSIFAEFEQVDSSTTRQYGGTGLGLAIASRLTEMMGGSMWAESELGVGSKFYMRVPLQIDRRGDVASHPATNLQELNVLIVDDNATNRALLTRMLENWNITPHVASDAHSALALLNQLRSADSPIQVVLSDVNMPNIDGFRLAEWIRNDRQFDDTRVILLSSSRRPGDAQMRRRLNIDAQLMKPAKSSELLRLLARAADDASGQVAQAPPKTETAAAAQLLQILLAEDNLVNQRLAVGLLHKHGHQVTIAANGREAVDKYGRGHFDVILMDVQMPLLDGFEATQQIREMEKSLGYRTPIIAMTAHAMKGDRERCLAAGMDHYVSKPIRLQTLLSALQEVLPRSTESPQSTWGATSINIRKPVDWSLAMQSVNGDRRLLCELIDAFRFDLPRMMDELERAIIEDDRRLLGRAAHSLKGSLVHLGAIQAADSIRELEHFDAHRSILEARGLVDQLRKQLDQLTPELDSFQNTVPRS